MRLIDRDAEAVLQERPTLTYDQARSIAAIRKVLTHLSDEAQQESVRRSQLGDTEGNFYAKGLRDAYATARLFVEARIGNGVAE